MICQVYNCQIIRWEQATGKIATREDGTPWNKVKSTKKTAVKKAVAVA